MSASLVVWAIASAVAPFAAGLWMHKNEKYKLVVGAQATVGLFMLVGSLLWLLMRSGDIQRACLIVCPCTDV